MHKNNKKVFKIVLTRGFNNYIMRNVINDNDNDYQSLNIYKRGEVNQNEKN